MSSLLEELYPSFRLYLFDGREKFSVPYTVFRPYRVRPVRWRYVPRPQHNRICIETMQRHFDGLIRVAKVNAHEVADYVSSLIIESARASGLVAYGN